MTEKLRALALAAKNTTCFGDLQDAIDAMDHMTTPDAVLALLDEIDRLKAENAGLRKDAEWRPIQEAPEGVSVLAVNDCGYIGRAMKERGRWNHIGSPTHWKPLPAPPDAAKGDSHE